MGQRSRILAQILGFAGFKVLEAFFEDADGVRLEGLTRSAVPLTASVVLRIERKWSPRCSYCGSVGGKLKEQLAERSWDDLPWAGRRVQLRYAPRRLKCRRCDRACVELLGFAEPYQRQTVRLQQHLALAAASAPVMHVAALYDLSWSTVRRAEGYALHRWAQSRVAQRLRYVGIDEKYLGRRSQRRRKFVTIVSDLETGEPLWIGEGREQATLESWLRTLTPDQKKAIELFAVDMFPSYRRAILDDPELAHAAIVHDPFHLVQQAGDAIDRVRREVFFRASEQLRAVGRGTRWLLLRGWEKLRRDQQNEVRALLRMNRRLAHAYQVKEELRYVLKHAPDRESMDVGLDRILRRTQRRNNAPMRRLHDCLRRHRDAILALAERRPPTGRIEALNNNWETLVRRGRGYHNLDYMLLKLRFAVVNPVRGDAATRRFLALGLPNALAA
jgi:transposase